MRQLGWVDVNRKQRIIWNEVIRAKVYINRVTDDRIASGFLFMEIDEEDARFRHLYSYLSVSPEGKIGEYNNGRPQYFESFNDLLNYALDRAKGSWLSQSF